jgi:pectate lyase
VEVTGSLNGRITSSKNQPIENISVKLRSLGIETRSDKNGEFQIVTSAVRKQIEIKNINGNKIKQQTDAPLSIDIVNLQGKTVYSQILQAKETDSHLIQIFPAALKSGVYVIKISSGNLNRYFKETHSYNLPLIFAISEVNKRVCSLTASANPVDSLELKSDTQAIGTVPVFIAEGKIPDIVLAKQYVMGTIAEGDSSIDSISVSIKDSNDYAGAPFKLAYNSQTKIFSGISPLHLYDQYMERTAIVVFYGSGKILNVSSSPSFTDNADTLGFDWVAIDGSEIVTLPSDQKFGGGDTIGSVLIGNSYTAGNGPGIYAVGDGGFRLYYNGELIATQTVAGKVTFVPLTFLPGKNVVAVSGVNGFGAPGVLIHIDELEKSYVSGSGWKVNSAPENNNWKSMSFNDASWASATVSGTALTTPGGLPISGFAPGSTARWIWSDKTSDTKVVLRYTFNIVPIGFGAATTGGAGGQVVVATTAAQIEQYLKDTTARTILVPEGMYEFRTNHTSSYKWCTCQCASADLNPQNTYYRVTFDGTCGSGETVLSTVTLADKWITCRANKSLIGMGRGANLRGSAITVRGNENGKNCIFRNLAIFDINPKYVEAGDGITPVTTSNIWVDHCSFKWISDGNDLESTSGATFSYVYYDGNNHLNCYRNDPYAALILDTKVTYHHCYWVDCSGRVPKVHASSTSELPTNCHLFNNVIDNCTFFSIGCSGTNALGKAAEVFTEYNYFKNVNALTYREENGKVNFAVTNVASGGNRYHWDANRTNVARPADAVFSPSSAYSYTTETDVTSLVTTVPVISGKGGKWISGSGIPEY